MVLECRPATRCSRVSWLDFYPIHLASATLQPLGLQLVLSSCERLQRYYIYTIFEGGDSGRSGNRKREKKGGREPQ